MIEVFLPVAFLGFAFSFGAALGFFAVLGIGHAIDAFLNGFMRGFKGDRK